MRLSALSYLTIASLALACRFHSTDAKLGEKPVLQKQQDNDEETHWGLRSNNNLDEAFPRLHLRDQKKEEEQRKLQELKYYGGQPLAEQKPLGLCEGDCDDDKDCGNGLICFQRDSGTPVPGCQGNDNSRNDYCITDPNFQTTPQPTTPSPTQPNPPPKQSNPSPTPQTVSAGGKLQVVGNNGIPANKFPLQMCQGDCDDDSECTGSLICFKRIQDEPVPGCSGSEDQVASVDYCTDPSQEVDQIKTTNPPNPSPTTPAIMPTTPSPTPKPPTQPSQTTTGGAGAVATTSIVPLPLIIVGNNGFPSQSFPLQRCEGECDSDDECDFGLICFRPSIEGTTVVPGCTGLATNGDFCTIDPSAAIVNPSPDLISPTATTGPSPTNSPTKSPTKSPTSRPSTGQPTPAPQPAYTVPPAIKVSTVGANGAPATVYPLGLCQGDCDEDSDCSVGLVCFLRNSNDAVPGCLGGEKDGSRADYCIPDPSLTPNPTASPTHSPTGKPTNSPTKRPVTPIPTPSPTRQPTVSPTVSPTRAPTTSQSSPMPAPVLVTVTSVSPPTSLPTSRPVFVPVTSDSPPTSLPTSRPTRAPSSLPPVFQVSVTPRPTKPPTNPPVPTPAPSPHPIPAPYYNVRLRLYWEEGYTWQESTTEKFFCMMSDYRGKPGTGRCWYGEKTQPCSQDELFVADCNNDKRQKFSIMFIQHDRVMLKVANDNRCFQRNDLQIQLRSCDPTNELQLWMSPRGAFYQRRFEIANPSKRDYCATQEHHPKNGEVVWLEPCILSRHPLHQTNYWMRW